NSKRFLSAMPPGHSSQASALLYEDPVAMAALKMGQLSPEIAGSFSHLAGQGTPADIAAYADETAIRGASASNGVDAGVILVGTAIAIPNLLRARTSANEASAVGSIRTLVTAEVAYSATYHEKGYARDLATLGNGPGEIHSAEHAGLIEPTLGNPTCTVGKWCVKSRYRFTLASVCKARHCEEFVAVGTPVSTNTGAKSFCSTSDGVVRSRIGAVLNVPLSATECQRWTPLY